MTLFMNSPLELEAQFFTRIIKIIVKKIRMGEYRTRLATNSSLVMIFEWDKRANHISLEIFK